MKASRVLALYGLLAVRAPAQTIRISDVLASAHNLSAGSPGPITSSDSRPCVFCHIPHGGKSLPGYLWNHQESTASYIPYQSPTLNAVAGDPAIGLSRLCLSCHDGTVALGQTVATGVIAVSGSLPTADVLGLDFRRHHPVGIQPVDDGQLYPGLSQSPPQSKDPSVRLINGRLECISCHDPHAQYKDPARGNFLVRSNQGGALCLACHDPSRPAPSQLSGWMGSAHQTATNSTPEFYSTVSANACLSCHLPHNPAEGTVPLLRAAEENTCARCHAGGGTSPALPSVMSEFSLAYSHPVAFQAGLHQPGEQTYPLNSNRHAECPDCHNAHAAQPSVFPATPPGVSPPLIGATGVDGLSGQTALRPATNQYEVCLKCHANSAGKPQATVGYSRYGRTAWRFTDSTVSDPFNVRLEFNSLISRHNVTYPRQRTNAQVPSLRPSMLQLNGAAGRSLAAGTYTYCTDCHNNDQARNSGGAQPSGPHGSSWPHILERRNDTEPLPAAPGGSSPGVAYQAGISGSYALCNKCHDIEGSILNDRSFKKHHKHLEKNAACTTCHDPHGINGGNLTNNYALINFDTGIVGPSSSGQLRYERLGEFSGQCYLRCHGEDHNPKNY